MEKKILLACFCQLFVCYSLFAQKGIPVDPNANCDWHWWDQTQENWTMANGEPAYRGGTKEICPPFASSSSCIDAHDLIVEIKVKKDYMPDQGWYFVRANFGHNVDYPYFILYNKYRAILRVFYFVGNSAQNLSHAAATLRFPNVTTTPPAILSSAVPYKAAPDKYSNKQYKDENGNPIKDLIVQSIPEGVIQNTWNAVDFAILFDPNYDIDKYKGAQMSIKIDGVRDEKIDLHGRAGSSTNANALRNDPFVYSGNGNQHTSQLDILKEGAVTLSTAAKYGESIVNELDSIKGGKHPDPQFLQDFKRYLQAHDVTDVLSTLSSISKVVGGYFSAVSFLNGLFGGGATSPVINYQVLEFTGSITTQTPLINAQIKIPGVLPSGAEDEIKSKFDCPLGLINLRKTPTIQVTKPYSRFCVPVPIILQGYGGKYVKYKLNENIEIAINDISGMQLLDLKLAILCKAQKNSQGMSYYSITDPIICKYSSAFPSVPLPIPLVNRVYQDLMKGKFIIHKYNPDKQIPEREEVYFGTPYVDPSDLKGVTFEVPQATDVYLGVSALFKVDKFKEPVLFHAKYNFDKTPVDIEITQLCENVEQPAFPESDYYVFTEPLIRLDKPLTTGTFITGTILMIPGFSSKPGFVAKAVQPYKHLGETIIERKKYPDCKTCN